MDIRLNDEHKVIYIDNPSTLRELIDFSKRIDDWALDYLVVVTPPQVFIPYLQQLPVKNVDFTITTSET